MDSSCEKIQSQLADYILDILNVEEINSINKHIGQCPECRQYMQALENENRILMQFGKELRIGESNMKCGLFISVLGVVIILGSVCQGVRVQWSSNAGGNDHFYEVVSVPGGINWYDANESAISSGGYLATITSVAENSFIYSLLDYQSHFTGQHDWGPWLGGYQPPGSREPAGGWRWVTGEPFTYTNWIPGNPDNYDGIEHFLHFFQGPKWNDIAPYGAWNTLLLEAYVVEYVVEPNGNGSHAAGLVDVNTVYQELEGFGAAGTYYESWLTAHPLKNEIYDVLFGQLGLDIYKIRNTYHIDENGYNWQELMTMSSEITQAAELSLGHPLKIMISSFSPPTYLKNNDSPSGGTLKIDDDGNFQYTEFAKWWVHSLEEYSLYGIEANYISIQNEPVLLAGRTTCKFTPTETTLWAGYNLALEAVYKELNQQMLELPKLLAPDSVDFGLSHDFIDMLLDPNHVYGYAHHLYSEADDDDPSFFISAMEDFAARYVDKPLFQTGYSCICDVEPFSVALDLARHIHNSLVYENVCSYFYCNLFLGNERENESGLVTLDNPWQDDPSYLVNHMYYAFKQFSAFTDPGWRRVEALTDSNDLCISAFINADANVLTVVIINVSETSVDLSLSLGGFSAEDSAVYRTSKTEYTTYIDTFDQSQPLSLTPRTITTVYMTTPAVR